MRNSIEFKKAGYADIVHVARNMRMVDRREIYAFDLSEDPSKIAANFARFERFHWGAYLDHRPVAVISAIEQAPTLWSVGMFATGKWSLVARRCAFFIHHVVIPTLDAAGCNRAECRSHIQHRAAHQLLALLGAKRECVVQDYGLRRETYVQYAWTRTGRDRKLLVDKTST